LLGLYLLVRASGRGDLLLAGVALAAAAGGFRSDFYVFATAVIGGAFFAWPGRSRFLNAIVVGVGAVMGSVPWFLVNYAVARHIVPLNAVYNGAPASFAYFLTAKLGTIPHYLVGMTVEERWRWQLTAVAFVVAFVARATWKRAPWVAAVALGAWAAAVLLLVRALVRDEVLALHGWLLTAPIAVLIVASPGETSDDGRAARIIAYATALHLLADYVLIVACYPNGFSSNGNGEWGPRYYIGIFPLLAVLSAQRVPVLARARQLAVATILVVVASVAVELDGLAMNRHLTLVSSRLVRLLDVPDDVPLISDLWWIPALRHEAMFRRPTFTIPIENPDRFAALVPRLWQAGYRRFQMVSMIGWAVHPFERLSLPDGLEIVMVQPQQQDKVQATILEIRQRSVDGTKQP
jgi:hypothetical protein